jgi:hypothetical protein
MASFGMGSAREATAMIARHGVSGCGQTADRAATKMPASGHQE